MGQKSRVGRPSKETIRVELRLDANDALTKKLLDEAQERGVSLQKHIADILTVWLMGKRDLPTLPKDEFSASDSASKLADEWM